jgi:phage terminase Nu1 subunit (DNA packaging protein)
MKKYEIAEILGVDTKTLNNWKENRKELYKIVMQYFEEKKSNPNYNDIDFLKQEMIKAIDKLPEHKTKKFYHLMMAELAEMGI